MCSEFSLPELSFENTGLAKASLSFSGCFLESSHCGRNMILPFYGNGNYRGLCLISFISSMVTSKAFFLFFHKEMDQTNSLPKRRLQGRGEIKQ